MKYAETNADAAPSSIATANAPLRNQRRLCLIFASIFSRGITGRAVNVVSSSSKCGCSIRPEYLANTRPLARPRVEGTFYRDLERWKGRKASECARKRRVCLRYHAAGLRAAFVKNFYTLFHAIVNYVSVEPVFSQQQLRVAVRDQPVGNTHTDYANLVL